MDSEPQPNTIQSQETSSVKNESIALKPEVAPVAPATPESLSVELAIANSEINQQEGIITNTADKVNEIRHGLGLEGEITDIPSVDLNKQKVNELTQRKAELEKRLGEVLKSDVSEKYEDVIEEVRKSKIDWAHSEELARRLKLKGATDEEVSQIRDWLVANATGAKTFVLPPSKFVQLKEILHEMTGEENIKEGDAFHVPGGRTDIPENIKSSVVLEEKPPLPPVPGKEKPKETINENQLHHEFSHVTEDGVLNSGLYTDWKAKTKEGAADPEYVGSIQETDVRVRAMFRDMEGLFDPHKERFNANHLAMLREKLGKGEVSNDTRELLSHYDDDQ